MRVLQHSIVLLMTSHFFFRGVVAYVTRGGDKIGPRKSDGREETENHGGYEMRRSKGKTKEEETSKASNEDALVDNGAPEASGASAGTAGASGVARLRTRLNNIE